MRRPSPERRRSSEAVLERLQHAAGRINPYLVVLAVGLGILDLTCLVLRAPHLTLTHCMSNIAIQPNTAPSMLAPAANAALRSGT